MYGCLTTYSKRNSFNSMFALIVSCSSVLSNIRSLPWVQLLLPTAHYSLQSLHSSWSCSLVIRTTLPPVAIACWELFIALPDSHFSTFLIFVASRLLHVSCSRAFSHFQPTTCCSSIVLRSPLSTTRILWIDSCFMLLASYLSSHASIVAQCFLHALLVVLPARYSRDIFCFLLISYLLVLSLCYLPVIANGRPRLLLVARCSAYHQTQLANSLSKVNLFGSPD